MQAMNPHPPGNESQIRCPRLGHQIHFAYCRSENRGLPCPKTLDCWHPHFQVEAHLRLELSPEQWQQTFTRPVQPNIMSLLELIANAQKTHNAGE